MSAYSELIKSFERIREYMREFYVYGFKSRDEYEKKSARSYDDERRRIESFLGDHMSFVRTPEGKNLFISIDSRTIRHNPFYKAWKAKSFTDGDITLHFIIFDILFDTGVEMTLSDIMTLIDERYLSGFSSDTEFDESTIRKKLKEYVEEGIAKVRKEGRKVYYRRSDTVDISSLTDMLHFFSETAPCGVIGSFLLDKTECDTDTFTFKHHYITGALDSGVLTSLFVAMREGRVISAANSGRKSKNEPRRIRLVPLRIFISVQSGRQYLAAYQPEYNSMKTFRLDYLSLVKLEEETPRFAELRAMLDDMQKHMWGVSIGGFKPESRRLEHVEFTVRVERGEDYIIKRLEREKRCGTVEALGGGLYRFTADVFDSTEMLPWIRTFICRIVSMNFSNRTVENRFKADLEKMYEMYGIGEGE